MELESRKYSNVVIRRATMEDLEEVGRIERLSFPNPYPRSFLYQLYFSFPEGFLVAELEGRIVGYVITRMRSRTEGHVVAIAVDPEYRGRGIGKSLVLRAMKILREKGSRRVRLEVRVSNEVAISLYKSLGFEIEGVIRRYYMDGEDAYLMYKYFEDEGEEKGLIGRIGSLIRGP
ncbi:ribosomal-protein-alanine N-acetyltransferase [Thermococci archaeon]|nr:MAG: ribosomal-protein-alanine N-acetyltransferase [Thermococci archaeon]RLF92396.1 MAG: ribosomal-protein-alanine N-acetyltransferase [Thermococci archaeon]